MNAKSEGFVREIALVDRSATETLGARIATLLKPGDAVALEGDLGAGKTTLARAILRGLGVHEPVPSPSFTLVQHYDTAKLPVEHFDLYRLEAESELDELGLEDALATGAALIEWPERAISRIPAEALRIRLQIETNSSRRARISGPSAWAPLLTEAAHDG
jgi:tRNA threonylcarbamoyl adenosine modification protein YjeE